MTGIIIQARMGSTRLPGKVLKPFFNGSSILDILIQKVKTTGLPIVVATSERESDKPIVACADKNGVTSFKGDEQDVLNRFITASSENGFSKVVRVCADNPFLNVDFLKMILAADAAGVDYLSYATSCGIPTIKTHYGLFAELVSLQGLEKVASLNPDPLYKEHVTNYIYTHPSDFKIKFLPISSQLDSNPWLRLTVDTEEDFQIAQTIYTELSNTRTSDAGESVEELVKICSRPEIKKAMEEQIRINSK